MTKKIYLETLKSALGHSILHYCCIAICADDTTLHSKCDQASDLWHNLIFLLNLNLIYETLWTGARIGLLISMLGKLNWFRLTSLTLVLVMWKLMGLFLRKNLLRCWGWPSLLNWIWALTFSLLIKLPPRKLEPYIVSWSFFLLEFKKYSDFCKTACWLRFCSLMKLMLLSRFWTQN